MHTCRALYRSHRGVMIGALVVSARMQQAKGIQRVYCHLANVQARMGSKPEVVW